MRSLMCLLILVLFFSVWETSSATDAIGLARNFCCGSFTNIRVPLKQIVSYQRTTSNCAIKAIVFMTKKGAKICVDPENTFVSEQVDKIDKRTSSATTATHASTSAKTEASPSTPATTPTHASTSAKPEASPSTPSTTATHASTSAKSETSLSTTSTTATHVSTSAKSEASAPTSMADTPV